ncbi:aminoacyl--tRNA ligase-related protein [Haloimpatiens massiliensis]|uniref:aminoacyl--tRNA ligase-related protein n=1 Tax=Haloimpatiens massiliensis TaxID=1658110 RepID=UPI000C817ED0|nr:aminoacyl--tRNA ligase-related protein [Haloimpatiens massiliensis]
MRKIYLPLKNSFKVDFKDEIYKKIYYMSEGITNYEIDIKGNDIVGMQLEVSDECDTDLLSSYVNEVIEKDIIGLKNIKCKCAWHDDCETVGDSKNVLEKMIEMDVAKPYAQGTVCIKEPFTELFYFFSELFKSIGKYKFNAESNKYPTLIKSTTLNKVGYFGSFPHLLMFVNRLENTVDNFNSFKEDFKDMNDEDKITEKLGKYMCQSDYALTPAACYHVYEDYENTEVDNKCVTTVGQVYRYENKYEKPFERLWEFNMRELVFLGTKSYVEQSLEKSKQYAINIIEDLELKGVCETANDPFFLTANNTNRINAQKMIGSKYELKLRVNKDDFLAVASFNLHSQFLSYKFNISEKANPNNKIYTGCFAVGIERIFFAFLSQYGVNKENWPEVVKNYYNRDTSNQVFFENYFKMINL